MDGRSWGRMKKVGLYGGGEMFGMGRVWNVRGEGVGGVC